MNFVYLNLFIQLCQAFIFDHQSVEIYFFFLLFILNSSPVSQGEMQVSHLSHTGITLKLSKSLIGIAYMCMKSLWYFRLLN